MTTQVEILQFLHYNPSSSSVEIAAALTNAPNERTLKRIIAVCVQKAMLMFYEQNNIAAFKQIVIEQYEFAVKNYF